MLFYVWQEVEKLKISRANWGYWGKSKQGIFLGKSQYFKKGPISISSRGTESSSNKRCLGTGLVLSSASWRKATYVVNEYRRRMRECFHSLLSAMLVSSFIRLMIASMEDKSLWNGYGKHCFHILNLSNNRMQHNMHFFNHVDTENGPPLPLQTMLRWRNAFGTG